MICPKCKKQMTADPCPDCGFLLDPMGPMVLQEGWNKAVLGQPGQGMSFGLGNFIELGKANAFVIDKGQSYAALVSETLPLTEHPAFQSGWRAFKEVPESKDVLSMQPEDEAEREIFWEGWNAAHDEQCKGRCPDCRARNLASQKAPEQP